MSKLMASVDLLRNLEIGVFGLLTNAFDRFDGISDRMEIDESTAFLAQDVDQFNVAELRKVLAQLGLATMEFRSATLTKARSSLLERVVNTAHVDISGPASLDDHLNAWAKWLVTTPAHAEATGMDSETLLKRGCEESQSSIRIHKTVKQMASALALHSTWDISNVMKQMCSVV